MVKVKNILARNAKEFDDMLKHIQLMRKNAGKKKISKIKLTQIIARKLKRKENLRYATFTKI